MAIAIFRRPVAAAAAARACSGMPHHGPDTLEGLLEDHLAKPGRRRLDEPEVEQRRLTSTRREAMSLYRDIWRASRAFVWPNEQGIPWRDVLRASARQEFELARLERDPEVIAKLLITGNDAVEAAVDRLVESMTKKNRPPDT